jgi:hypothetical protein
MVSFRFHIVSIIAVFLGIAVGVVVGSTYVDRAIVEGLRNRIKTVEDNVNARRDEIAALEAELRRDDDYLAASADFAVTERLTDVPVVVFALRGVEGDVVQETALLARRAGAIVPGVVWLEPKWQLESDEDREALATVLGRSGGSVDTLQREVLGAAMAELAGDEPTQPTVTAPAAQEVLDELVELGFLALEPLDDGDPVLSDVAGAGPRLLVVTGTDADPQLDALFPMVVAAAVEHELAVVAAEVYVPSEDGASRGASTVDALSETVRSAIALVDHADLVQGRVAAVLALDVVDDGVTGHFGYGSGADAVVPAWSPP